MTRYDIIGDIHGCYDELYDLLGSMGYDLDNQAGPSHYADRKVVFVGDLCDRGPKNCHVLQLVMDMVESGVALLVMGNHDSKLYRWLKGNKVTISNGLQTTIDDLDRWGDEFKQKVHDFLAPQPWKHVLDDGRLIVVHAAAPERLQGELTGKKKKAAKAAAFYGVTTGKYDAEGFPERIDWAQEYSGEAVVVHGHVAQLETSAVNGVYNVDTACVYGNKLTALRYPEMEFVSVPARLAYRQGRMTPERLKLDD